MLILTISIVTLILIVVLALIHNEVICGEREKRLRERQKKFREDLEKDGTRLHYYDLP